MLSTPMEVIKITNNIRIFQIFKICPKLKKETKIFENLEIRKFSKILITLNL
jgi:hypothetical protein